MLDSCRCGEKSEHLRTIVLISVGLSCNNPDWFCRIIVSEIYWNMYDPVGLWDCG